jgi:hypothetical protein
MSLADLVNVSITSESVGVTAAGFGVPAILSYSVALPDRVTFYSSTTAMVTDGFAVTDPEYLAAQAILGASTKVTQFAVLRGDLPPTQVYKISVKTVTAGAEYALRVGADEVSFTAGAGSFAGNDEIVTQLNAQIQAADGYATSGFTSAVAGSIASKYVNLTASTAGNWIAVELHDISLLDVQQNQVDPGVATDLAACVVEDNTWYGIMNPWGSTAMNMAIAAWAEANEKLFIAADCDSRTANLALSTDVALTTTGTLAARAKTAAYARTAVIYHPATDAFADAAWLGKCLPMDPGSETWAYKTLAGVAAVALTSTYRTNVLNKFANVYETVSGVNVTEFGKVAANEYVDVVRFRDWLKARIAERIYAKLVNLKKLPFTDAGIAVVQAEILGQLDEGVRVGGLASDPAPDCIVPKASAVSAANKTARLLSGVTFSGTLAGAIHTLTINGTLSV